MAKKKRGRSSKNTRPSRAEKTKKRLKTNAFEKLRKRSFSTPFLPKFFGLLAFEFIAGAIPLVLFWSIYQYIGVDLLAFSGENSKLMIGGSFLVYALGVFGLKMRPNLSKVLAYILLILLAINVFLCIPLQMLNGQLELRLFAILTTLVVGSVYLVSGVQNEDINIQTLPQKWDKWKDWIVPAFLATFFITALIFRFWGYNEIGFYVDENNHIQFAYDYSNGIVSDYDRAAIISYLTIFMNWLGGGTSYGDYFAYGRIPSIIAGALTVFPIYLLGKRISKLCGLVAAYLWAILPWAIGFAVYIREYSLYVFVGTCACYVAVLFFEGLLSYQKKNLKKLIFFAVFLTVNLLFAFFYDYKSTLKGSVIVWGCLGAAYVLVHLPYFISRYGRKGLLAASLLLTAMAVSGYFLKHVVKIDQNADFLDFRWFDVFFRPDRGTPGFWWGSVNNSPFLVFAILSLGYLFSAINKKGRIYLTFCLCLLGFLFLYYFYFPRKFRPKYLSYLSPIFTILVAGFIAEGIRFSHILLRDRKIAQISAVFIMAILGFFLCPITKTIDTKINPPYVGAYYKATAEYHINYKLPIYIIDNQIPDIRERKGITSVYDAMLEIEYGMDDLGKFNVQKRRSMGDALDTIGNHDAGIMVFDAYRNQHWGSGFPIQRYFRIGDKKFEMLADQNFVQIYKWDKILPGEENNYPVFDP